MALAGAEQSGADASQAQVTIIHDLPRHLIRDIFVRARVWPEVEGQPLGWANRDDAHKDVLIFTAGMHLTTIAGHVLTKTMVKPWWPLLSQANM
ncbi:hypothetical protein FOA52_005836 [Chlamydomonas sp. UWO 241]|nr:hypothetical protein FOA52_005836 [Chlamydomonas sp. UWO 241]